MCSGVARLTGLSSGRLVKCSPVISSYPGTLGLLYDMLYTLPDGRWTYLSEMRARIISSGTSRLTIKVSGIDLVLRSSQISATKAGIGYLLQVIVQHLPLSKGPWETVEDPWLQYLAEPARGSIRSTETYLIMQSI